MRRIQGLLLLFILGAVTMFAQLNGRLTGTVIDPTGASVPGAQVSLFLPGGKAALLTTTTNSEGLFDFAAVRPDTYILMVESSGFAKYSQMGVNIDPVRQTTVPPIHLALSTTSQTLEVVAPTLSVDTSTAEVSTTVTQEQISNLPVLDRQISNLLVTQAGVAANGRANTVINGLRPSYSNMTLDGINFQDSVRINGLDYLPTKLTISQVGEFTVSTTNSSPTIGGGSSTISMMTPSGGNTLHGEGYWYNRNGYFGANDWFNNKSGLKRPFVDLNQLGGVISGPIKKDKLFFFGNYEAYRMKQQTPVTNTILTPAARQGILTYRDASGALQTYNVLQPANLSINPAIQSMLTSVPTTGNNTSVGDGLNTTGYSFNARDNETRDNVTTKLDYNLSTKHVFSFSHVWNRDIVDRPDYTPFYTTIPVIYNNNTNRLVSASWRWTPTATLTNELRGGVNRSPGEFANRQTQPAYFITGTVFSSPLESSEVSEGRQTNFFTMQDNANWIHGRHSVSFGFQMNTTHVDMHGYNGTIPSIGLGISSGSQYGFSTGQIPGANSTFTTMATNLQATLAGIVTSNTQTFNPSSRTSGFVPGAPYRFSEQFNQYAGYGVDVIKLLSNLTLTLGLRWDYFAPVDETNGMFIEPVVSNGNPVTTLLSNATLDFTGGGTGRPFYKKDRNNFAPNVALAWDPTGQGKMSIRGGFNIAYVNDNAINDVFNAAFSNPGFTSTITTSNLVGVSANQAPSIKIPTFQVPTTAQAQFAANNSQGIAMYLVDPNLVTPYVVQWNVGVQRQFKGFIAEARYVGDHGTKLFRTLDYNQVSVSNGGFLQDFTRAQNNGFAAMAAGQAFNPAYNASIPGSQQLTFFPLLPGGGSLTNSTIKNYILQGAAGTLAQTYQSNLWFPYAGYSYFPNPLALVAGMMQNYSNSTYNGAQFEITKRTAKGMQFQANYTFSKAITDAFGQRGLDMQLDNNNPKIEKARANFDQTHSFKINHYVPLPFGKGQRFLNTTNPVISRVISGWGLSGFAVLDSGNPLSIYTGGLGTLNRGARSTYNTASTNLTLSQLKALTGLHMTGNGPYLFDQSIINPVSKTGTNDFGAATYPGQVFYNPTAGTVGSLQRRDLNAPWYMNYNFSLSKTTKITERQSVELHANFFNIFNHPNFYASDQNINSTTFGKITSQFYSMDGIGPRALNFGLVYKF
jgi:hypothetical protein